MTGTANASTASAGRATHGKGLRSRPLGEQMLLINNAGRFARVSRERAARCEKGELCAEDALLLHAYGLAPHSDLEMLSATFQVERRRFVADTLDYLILVPTLRCNLTCSYCQVSRASQQATGFDWSAATLDAVLALVRGLEAPAVKIEFQGGEPTLRIDLIEAVIAAVPAATQASFVICANLQQIDDRMLKLFDRADVQISTSLDGSAAIHQRQRHASEHSTTQFLANLDNLLERYGPGKISALPTIDPLDPPPIDELIAAFATRGLSAIYLRPINYQGFARKRHPGSRRLDDDWRAYHARFIRRLIEINWQRPNAPALEESYFSLLLRRIFRAGEDRHVDLRNPSPVGRDYIVIDHDGHAYPSDEARMLSRAGIIDLAIGDVASGWDTPVRAAIEAAATSDGDPDCEACAYQPFCGRDLVDDISRYGTIAMPRRDTEFCRRHLHLFDLAFELIHADDRAIQHSLRRWLGLRGDHIHVAQAA